MAPLTWLLVLAGLIGHIPDVPRILALSSSVTLGVGAVWLWIAVAPGRTDWTLARQYWPSALVFLALWAATLYRLVSGLR